MRQYKFDKPLVESATPPRSTDVYWIDVDETTRDLLTIKKYESNANKWENALAKPGYFSVTTSVAGEGMTLAADKSFCEAGDTVVLTVSLEEGYHVDDIEITYSGGTISASEIDETHWSFVMPSGDVEVIGSAEEGEPVGKIRLFTQFADPDILSIDCEGELKVYSIKNGEQLVQTYTDLVGERVVVQADANTQIVMSGIITGDFQLGDNVYCKQISVENTQLNSFDANNSYLVENISIKNDAALKMIYCNGNPLLSSCVINNTPSLTSLNCTACYALTSLDLSKNTSLTSLNCSNCTALTSLDISKNTALTVLYCGSCYALTSLDLSKNTSLTDLSCEYCKKLISISYPATNSSVSTSIANAITDADSATGTVYTDSQGAYYSTIANDATTKGWTILPIPE